MSDPFRVALQVSFAGFLRPARCYRSWEKVQKEFTSKIGLNALAMLRAALESAELAVSLSLADQPGNGSPPNI